MQYAKETQGEIITWNKKPIKPWYFSQSSGRTLSALEYCEGKKQRGELPSTAVCQNPAYLQSVADPGGEGFPQKGHGVGISGIGVTYFASTKGWDYKKIIKYYLNGTEIEDVY